MQSLAPSPPHTQETRTHHTQQHRTPISPHPCPLVRYGPYRGSTSDIRKGMLVSTAGGRSTLYALGLLEPRGMLFVEPGTDVYEGMVIGEHSRCGGERGRRVAGAQRAKHGW